MDQDGVSKLQRPQDAERSVAEGARQITEREWRVAERLNPVRGHV
jgi:hypothetical protein